MALTADAPLIRRGQRTPGDFGYPVAPGEKVFKGSLLALNANGQVQRAQTAGGVVIVGVADRTLDNSGNAGASTEYVIAQRGIWGGIAITGEAFNKVGSAVYATDDGALNVTNSGSLLTAGTISGYDVATGQYFVELEGTI